MLNRSSPPTSSSNITPGRLKDLVLAELPVLSQGGDSSTTELVLPQIEIEESTQTYARMVAEPLEAGFGTTLGNALRRVLLSSLPGAAVTSVRIDQVQHEFSTIPGMKEDTIEFLLNAKEIRLRALSDR